MFYIKLHFPVTKNSSTDLNVYWLSPWLVLVKWIQYEEAKRIVWSRAVYWLGWRAYQVDADGIPWIVVASLCWDSLYRN